MPFYPGFFILFGGPNRNLFGFLSIWCRSTGFPSPKSQIDCITYLRNSIWYLYLETVASGLRPVPIESIKWKKFHQVIKWLDGMGPSSESCRPRADLLIYIVGTEDVGKLYCCCSTFCEILAVDPLNFTWWNLIPPLDRLMEFFSLDGLDTMG